MMSETLKNKIIPEIKNHLLEEDWEHIPDMINEAYITKPDEITLVSLKPCPQCGDISMQFNINTGEYVELTSWKYIKTVGVLL